MKRPWRRKDAAEPVESASGTAADGPPLDMTGESVRVVPAAESPRSAEPEAEGDRPVGEAATVPSPEPPAPVPASEVKPTSLVIGDDDAFMAEPEILDLADIPRDGSTVVKMDPRLRRRRIDVRRAAGRKRLLIVLAIVGVFAIAVAVLAVLASPLFSVSKVQISGNVYTTAEELAPIIDEAKDSAILTLDTDAIAERLEQLPWVRRARVEADFPSTLKIELAERRPVAAFAGDDGNWRVIDRDGRVIAVIPDGAQPVDYLAIAGTGPSIAAGTNAGDRYRIAGELAQSLPAELRVVTAQLTLTDAGAIGLVLTSGTTVDLGQPSDLRNKLSSLITLLRENEPSTLASVNMADPFNPTFSPATQSPSSGG